MASKIQGLAFVQNSVECLFLEDWSRWHLWPWQFFICEDCIWGIFLHMLYPHWKFSFYFMTCLLPLAHPCLSHLHLCSLFSVLCSPHCTFSATLFNGLSAHSTNPEFSQLLASFQVSLIHEALSFLSVCLKDPSVDQVPSIQCWYGYSCLIIIFSAYSFANEDNSPFSEYQC